MTDFLKLSLLFFLVLSISMTSCSSDGDQLEEGDELTGIQLVTTRSNVESEGLGLACNFGQIIKEHLDDIDFDEINEEIEEEGGEEIDTERLDELLEELFGGLGDKTMYVVVAGDNIDLESKEEIEVAGEAFSLSWFSDTEEPTPGIYEALGAKINIEDPDDLENGAEVSKGKIEVVVTEISDEFMVGTFSGNVQNKDGIEEAISGEFNVERVACEE